MVYSKIKAIVGFGLMVGGMIITASCFVEANGKVRVKDLNNVVNAAEKIAVTVVNEAPALTSNN